MKSIRVILIGGIVLFSWIFFFPYSAGGEFAWQLQSIPLGMTSKRNSNFYYLIADKTILCLAKNFSLEVSGIAAAEKTWRVLRKSSEENIWQIWKSQELQAEYKGEGYPFIKEGNLFHISSDNTVLKRYSLTEGQLLWERFLPSSLLSLSLYKDCLALGLSGGEVFLVEDLGSMREDCKVLSFRDSLISGLALSEYKGIKYLALTEGTKKTYWHLYSRLPKESQWKEIAGGDLGKPLGRETRVIFDRKQPLVFIEIEQAIYVYDLVKAKASLVTIEGYLIDAFHSLGLDYFLTYSPEKKRISYSSCDSFQRVKTLFHYEVSEPQWAFDQDAIYLIDMALGENMWCLRKG